MMVDPYHPEERVRTVDFVQEHIARCEVCHMPARRPETLERNSQDCRGDVMRSQETKFVADFHAAPAASMVR